MNRKKSILLSALLLASSLVSASANSNEGTYTPAPENLEARRQFSANRFGIFIHWGIYSMFGQGEWYLNNNINADEYAKAARGFYPADFDAEKWVSAIKRAGARYITITSRHHDGFSMWDTEQSAYNIVDGTPFGRDILKELADECHKQGITLNFYYSHLDWTRDDYPIAMTGQNTGRDRSKADFDSYYRFMNAQLRELLTNYGPIGAIWFDGMWDQDFKGGNFDWRLGEQYDLIHSLQPACLIGNNHHVTPFPGEDIQIFERDLPGQNTAGWNSDSEISQLPLETCNTMNGMWGYQISDQNYKSSDELIRYLVKAAGMGANLLLNVGPQPNGELPAAAIEQLTKMGDWLEVNGETIYDTQAGPIEEQEWGTSTQRGKRVFVHILNPETREVTLPAGLKLKKAFTFADKTPVRFTRGKEATTLHLPEVTPGPDFIVELETK